MGVLVVALLLIWLWAEKPDARDKCSINVAHCLHSLSSLTVFTHCHVGSGIFQCLGSASSARVVDSSHRRKDATVYPGQTLCRHAQDIPLKTLFFRYNKRMSACPMLAPHCPSWTRGHMLLTQQC